MSPISPYEQPIRISVVENELVFLSERVSFSMTPEAARQTLHNLAAALVAVQLGTPASRAPLIVLLVEDEPLIREVAAAVLEAAGYTVLLADGARAALLTLEGGAAVDLMFTNVQMPGDLDGVGLAQAVSERWPAIALLLTSGELRPAPETLPVGGRFLAKPYIPADLLTHIGELTAA